MKQKEGEKNSETTLDDFFKLGRYTLLVCLMSEFCILNQVGNWYYMMYAGVTPTVVGCGKHNFSHINRREICSHLIEIQRKESCIPKLETQFKSVNYEWGHYCSGAEVATQIISAQMIGGIIGSVFFGIASDIFGRKWVILLTVIFCQVFMILSSFTNDLFWFTVCRFVVMFFNEGSYIAILVFIMENTPKRDRLWIKTFVSSAPNIMIFSLLAYFSADWRILTRISAALAIPAIIAICRISESPRFLIQRGRLNEAKRVIQRMCRIDGRNFDEADLDRVLAEDNRVLLESKSKGRSYTCLFLLYFFYLFYTPKFAKYTIALGFSLIVTNIMNYTLLFNAASFSDSIYLNVIFFSGMRYIMNMSIVSLERYVKCVGRKMIHCVALIFVEVLLAVLIYIIYTDIEQFILRYHIVPLLIAGICSQLYILNAVVSVELFPTCLRPRSIVFSQSFAKLGYAIYPNNVLLRYIWRDAWPYASVLILVVANQFLFHHIIPETKGQPLNDHMPGPEQRIFRKKASKDKTTLQDPEAAQKLNENEG